VESSFWGDSAAAFGHPRRTLERTTLSGAASEIASREPAARASA
jgi:hypothetical protein